ncbi:hypothetical protein WKT22_00915 [Candidatus Lokiarchaeum ossiferum]
MVDEFSYFLDSAHKMKKKSDFTSLLQYCFLAYDKYTLFLNHTHLS